MKSNFDNDRIKQFKLKEESNELGTLEIVLIQKYRISRELHILIDMAHLTFYANFLNKF
jgi:hypothetical protein